MSDKARLLLDTAIELFFERGFWDTPTAMIAKKAGVANGTLFNYFPSKKALISGVYLHLKQSWSDHLEAGIPPDSDLRSQLFACWKRAIDWPVDNPKSYALLEQLKLSEDAEIGTLPEGVQLFGSAFSLIGEALQTGLIRPLPPELIHGAAIAQICATVQHISSTETDGPPQKRDEIIAISFDMFWRGIAAHSSGE